MSYFPKLADIKMRCERAFYQLEEVNPDHALMLFDGTGLEKYQQERLTDRLMEEFGPNGYNSDCPTDEELCLAFESLHNALESAVVIEQAKAGFFKPN